MDICHPVLLCCYYFAEFIDVLHTDKYIYKALLAHIKNKEMV